MRCTQCHKSMSQGEVYDLPDASGHLTVSIWRCGICAGVQEQIQIYPESGRGERRLVTYAVRSWSVADA